VAKFYHLILQHRNKYKNFILFFLIAVILKGQDASAFWAWNKNYLAKVNQEIVQVDNLQRRLDRFHEIKDLGEKMKIGIPNVDYRKILNELINDLLMVQDAVRIGLDNLPEYQARYNLTKVNLSLDMLHQEEVLDKVKISDKEIQDRFVFLNESVKIKHMVAKNRPRAEAFLTALNEGADFSIKLEEKEIEITEKTIKRGELPQELESFSFSSAEGETSGLIEKKDGFNAIRIEKKISPDKDINEKADKKIRKILFREKAKIRNDEYFDSLRENAEIIVNDDALEALSWKNKSNSETLSVATVNGIPIKGNEIIAQVNIPFINKNREDIFKKTMLDKLIRDKLLDIEIAKRGYGNHENVQSRLSQIMNPYLLEIYRNKIVARFFKIEEEEVRKYYQDHEKKFRRPNKVKLRKIRVFRYQTAYDAFEELKKGADIGIMAMEISQDSTASKKGDTGWIEVIRLDPMIQSYLDKMEIGGIYGPFATKPGYIILRMDGKMEGDLKSFEEVKRNIVDRISKKKYDLASEEYVKRLRSQSKIEINERALKRFIKSKN
jgi:parvulin-like peptidyl-prolyl isomerase